MTALIHDLRFGWRALAKTPGVTLVVILSLALGIGANTAIFTLINSVMLKDLPVHDPQQLVLFGDGSQRGVITGLKGRWNIFSHPLYEQLRDDASFQSVCAFRTELDRLSVRRAGAGGPVQLAWGRLVSGNYFSVLGVQAAVGRALTPDDARLAAPAVVVMSHNYWERVFNADPSIVGQNVTLNGTLLATVAGVTPPEFFGESLEAQLADFWLPITMQAHIMSGRPSVLDNASVNWLNFMGRLKPGVGVEQAQAEINVSFQQFLRSHARPDRTPHEEDELRQSHIALTPGGPGVSNLRSGYSEPLYILLAVVGLVLLIACANVANVLLSRSAAREKEISMRLALGASRFRLVRQLLTESILLAGLGGALGVLFAAWGVSILIAAVSSGSRNVPLDTSPDIRVLGFTLAVSLLTGILFGLVPALRASKADLVTGLKASAQGSGSRLRLGPMRTLVVSQVGLSLALLVAAGLFLKTFDRLRAQDLGFDREHVLEVGIDPRIAGYQPSQLEPLYQSLLERVHALPEVSVASLSLYSPMSRNNWSGGISVEGYLPPENEMARTQWIWVGPRYLETLGLSIVRGRDIGPADTEGAPRVAVVNETFVRRYLEGQNAVGKRLSMNVPAETYEVEIVGVVKDFKFNSPWLEHHPITILPLTQASMPPARYASYLEVRAIGDPISVASSIRRAVQEVDNDLPVTSIQTLSDQIDQYLTREGLVANLSGFFGALALLLACIGLYGVLSYATTRRSNEIGIRMALGAQRGDVVAMVLRETFGLVLAGIGFGLLMAFGVSRLIASQLYGVTPLDPATLAAAAVMMVAATALAGFLPAQRASRLDPIIALRSE